jgi:hypothetical protein
MRPAEGKTMARQTHKRNWMAIPALLIVALVACDRPAEVEREAVESEPEMNNLLNKYTSVTLTADLSDLSENQRRMIALLIEAGQSMNDAFWLQAYGDRQTLLDSIADADLRRFAEINYGPWDRLDANQPFIDGHV